MRIKSINFILLIGLCLLSIASIAQNKQDYYWPFGSDQGEEPGVQVFALDFNQRPFVPVLRTGELEFDQSNASICDKDGRLLFYTNGCAVANRLHQQMPNGDSINAGPYFDDFWGGDCSKGYVGPQDNTILPDPGNPSGYYLIHKPFSYNPDSISEKQFTKDSLKYTYVDMSLENGYGDVTEKNVKFYEGSMLSNYLTPIAQANGHDWWIMNPVFPEGFLIYALTEEGLEYNKIEPGPVWDTRYSSSSGYARFSPDGEKYAYFNEFEGLFLYDFDRTDATLSAEQHLPFPMPVQSFFTTCEWSPNSRFLYMAKYDTLWQLDTWAEPLDRGLEFIAERATTGPDPTRPSFGVTGLGPDCRIYIRSKSSSKTFHVIHKPDELGLACDFVQQAFALPSSSAAGSFPNFPRFRVDEEEKCDPSIVSIVGETVWWRRDLTVYPIPTTGPITIELPEDHYKGMIYVLDMQGQMVLHREVEFLVGELSLDLSYLPSGIYSVEYVARDSEERVVWTERVVVE